MAGKKRNDGNLWKDIGFVVGCLLLLAALGGIYYLHRVQKQAQTDRLQAIIANEQAPGINSSKILGDVIEETTQTSDAAGASGSSGSDAAMPETAESAARADAEPEQAEPGQKEPGQEESGQTEAEPAAPDAEAAETTQPDTRTTEAESSAQPEQEEEPGEAADQEPLSGDVREASVVVLNGSYRNGVASYWEQQLTQAGYQHLYTGSYGGQAEQQTVIYTAFTQAADTLKEIFPSAEIREGAPPAAYTLSVEAPETIDFYVVIGLADAVTQ